MFTARQFFVLLVTLAALPASAASVFGADTPLWIFNGEAAGDYLGYSVAGAGDVNKDGYADLIVGAYNHDGPGGISAGKVYVRSGLTGGLLWSFNGEAASDYFGYSVAGAGDVNGDGHADLIVGALGHDGLAGANAGKAYVYSGLTGSLLWSFDGQAAYDDLGESVAGAGDVNNDGYDDLIVGAPYYDPLGRNDAGKFYVYSGQTGLLLLSLTGEAAGDHLGGSVAGAGDVNKDGYADLVIGAKYHDGLSGAAAGRAYVCSGSTGLVLWSFDGEAASDLFGSSVAGAGDVNKDGNADLIVGALYHDGPGGDEAGKAYVYSGLTGGLLWSFNGQAVYDYFGQSVAGAGDMNQDGYADLIVGADYHNGPGGSDAGKAYVYSGSTGLLLWSFYGEAANDNFGWSVAGAGDVNQDGYADLIVGAVSHDGPGGNDAGRAYVFTTCGTWQSISPAMNALGASATADASVIFRVDMNAGTINSSNFLITAGSTGPHPGTVSYNALSRTATCNPNFGFAPGEVVTVVLTDDILPQTPPATCWSLPYTWSFTVEATGGSGEFDSHVDYSMGDGSTCVVPADFDDDGDIDLATTGNNDGKIWIRLNNGNGTFAGSTGYFNGMTNPRWSAAADFDGDGDIDLASVDRVSNRRAFLLNAGDGTFTNGGYNNIGSGPTMIVAADFNADGRMDLAFTNSNDDNMTVQLNQGSLVFGSTNYAVGDFPSAIASGDLDGDGDIDLISADGGTPSSYTIRWNDGAGGFAEFITYGPLPGSPADIAVGDFDGDADLDLALPLYNLDQMVIAWNDGTGNFPYGTTKIVGDWPQGLTAADFDGDGDLDLACANSIDDNVWVYLNDGTGVFIPALNNIFPVNDNPREVCAADLDGDGDMDLATANLNSDDMSILLNQTGCNCGVWGDVSGEGQINPVDVVKMVNFVYKSNDTRVQPPNCPRQAGDVNCDNAVNPVDVVKYVNYVYKGQTNAFCADPCGP